MNAKTNCVVNRFSRQKNNYGEVEIEKKDMPLYGNIQFAEGLTIRQIPAKISCGAHYLFFEAVEIAHSAILRKLKVCGDKPCKT